MGVVYLITSPEGVLLGAAESYLEIKAILKRSIDLFVERRQQEEIHRTIGQCRISGRGLPSFSEFMTTAHETEDKIRLETSKFVEDCKIEQIS